MIFLGYNFYWKDVVGLRVMSYNTWGIPHTFGSQDKEERMEKIGQLLAEGDYDIVLLEELWMRPDHQTIKGKLGPELYMTEYDDLNMCQGTIWPWGCSGLAIISRSVRNSGIISFIIRMLRIIKYKKCLLCV